MTVKSSLRNWDVTGTTLGEALNAQNHKSGQSDKDSIWTLDFDSFQ